MLEHKQVDNITIFKSLCVTVQEAGTKETQNLLRCLDHLDIFHMLHLSVVDKPSLCVNEDRMTSQLLFGFSWFNENWAGLVQYL